MKFAHIMDGENRLRQISMHRWFWRSALLVGLLSVGIAAVSVLFYMEYADLYSEHTALKSGTAELHACLERKRELKEKATALQAQCTKMNNIKYRPKSPTDVLSLLQNGTSDVTVQEVVLKKKKVDLVLFAHSTQAILLFADHVRARELCTQVEVTSIEQVGDRVKALLRIDLR